MKSFRPSTALNKNKQTKATDLGKKILTKVSIKDDSKNSIKSWEN